MKKLLSIFIFLCLVSSLVACGQRQPVGEEPGEPIPTKPPQETNPDFVDNRYFINQDAPATKVFHFEGEDIELIYQNTLNKNDLPLEERPDNYGFYDIYVDKIGEDNTEFTFLDNTDILCGIFCNSYSPPLDIDPIGEELIVEKALEYLTAIYSSDMINSYILDACKFDQNQKQSYSICFYKALQGIKTDDQIWMTVRLDSKIKSFNAHNIYRYDQFIDTLPKINKPKTEEALMKQAT
ncbi:MAG: hypothetical protein FWE80_05390, partial [Oscillospiraceae bacterium]|nr:hypothetical protein [Oscillospiraceae bacterium]